MRIRRCSSTGGGGVKLFLLEGIILNIICSQDVSRLVLIPVQKSCILKGSDLTIFTLYSALQNTPPVLKRH
jgi:hypothetical protein